MLALDLVFGSLDFARSRALQLLSRSVLLTALLGRRDHRLAALGSLQIVLLFGLTLRWPVAMYFLGPVVLGVVHLAADLRYLVFRRTLPRHFLTVSLAIAVALTSLRVCTGLGVATATLGAQVDIAIGVGWVGLALGLRWSDNAKRLLGVGASTLILSALLVRHAELTQVALAHFHNIAAFGLWLTLFRRRLGWTALPVVLAVFATLVLLSGQGLPWTVQHGGLSAFGQRASRLGAGLAPGLPLHLATRVAVTFVFLQSVHYAIWTGWIAQDCLPGEGTPTFRMSLRSLTRDFRPLGVSAVVLVTSGFAISAAFALRESVAWYMVLARAHIWFELAAFAYLVGRPPVDPHHACSPVVASLPKRASRPQAPVAPAPACAPSPLVPWSSS